MAKQTASERRVPQDKFEEALFRGHIQSEVERWYNTDKIKITVGEDHENGVYDLYIWQPEDDFDMLRTLETKGEMSGKVWLAENSHPTTEHYRVQVWHLVEGRPANCGYPPVVRWNV